MQQRGATQAAASICISDGTESSAKEAHCSKPRPPHLMGQRYISMATKAHIENTFHNTNANDNPGETCHANV